MPKRKIKNITILIADDHPVTRAGIRTLIAQAEDMKVIGEARDSFEVKKLIPKLRPNILLLDLKMPGSHPYEIEKWIRENYPEVITLVLTSHDRDAYLATMMDAGVAGYLIKQESTTRLVDAIRRAAEGVVYFSDEQIARAQKWEEEVIEKWKNLTKREQDVLQHLATGEDNKTMAKSLHVSRKTIEFHVSNILRKLDMDSRDKAIVWMLKHRPDDPDIVKD